MTTPRQIPPATSGVRHSASALDARRRGLLAAAAVALAVFVIAIGVLATLRTGSATSGAFQLDPVSALEIIGLRIVRAGWPVLVLALSAVALARAILPLCRAFEDSHAIAASIAGALLLWLAVAAGWAGWLIGGPARLLTFALALGGLGVVVRAAQKHLRSAAHGAAAESPTIISGTPLSAAPRSPSTDEPRENQHRPRALAWLESNSRFAWLLGLPGLAVLLVAACNPPGALWASEFGGYDALSYHLQLPQEWIAAGRVAPLTHNVYSFLPSGVEALFVHLAVVAGAARAPTPDSPQFGLLSGDGMLAVSCQLLHVAWTLLATWLIARLGRRVLESTGVSAGRAHILGIVSGCFVLCTPWSLVVGSLAYNEMALLACCAGALLAACNRAPSLTRRAALAAIALGGACLAKPTALIFGGLPVALALAWTIPARAWVHAVALGILAGTLMVAPWLARNAAHGGNPVFPFATRTFGTAHWTPAHAARFSAGHAPPPSLRSRLALIASPDVKDPSGPRHRGMLHPQHAAFFPLVLLACALGVARRSTRAASLLFGVIVLAQTIAWLATTHIQARFLLPLYVPGAGLIALALAALPWRLFGLVIAAALPLGHGVWSVARYARERSDAPGSLLHLDPIALTGLPLRAELDALAPEARAKAEIWPLAWVNLQPPRDGRVLLVGDATPFYATAPVAYSTTWDESPLAAAMRAAPDDPGAWSAALRRAGIAQVLINSAELARLERSGFADPLLTPQRVGAWAAQHTILVRRWSSGTVLVELPALR